MIYTRNKISSEREKDLMIGLIADTRFCREVMPSVKKDLLQVDQFKVILDWIQDYYKKYDEAPKENIEKIYIAKRQELDQALGDNIEIFLRTLSKKLEGMESFNTDYYSDESIKYLKERNLQVLLSRAQGLIDIGNVDEAEQVFSTYRKVARTTSKWINPLSKEFVESVLFKEEEYLFQFPGAVGALLGKLKRKQLVAVLAPMKRGKTWWMLEALWLLASNHLKAVLISLEMDEEEIGSRSFKRITGMDYEKEEITIPVFDCLRNQKNRCNLPIRESNSDGLPLDELDMPPAYSEKYNHTPCSACRDKKDGNFIPGIWYVKRTSPKIDYSNLTSTLKSFEESFGDNIRIISYPMNTANISDVKRDLDLLEYTEGFVPDGIVLDYADILGPEDSRLVGRDSINQTWKMLKNLAQERNSLVITATQSNRGSMDRRRVKPTDTSEDIRKLAHVNLMVSLNQTPREKRRGLMRLGVSVARGVEFDELQEVLVVQELSIGQPFLDSEVPGFLEDEGENHED